MYDTDDSSSQLPVSSSNSDVSKILVFVPDNDSLSENSDLQKNDKAIEGCISYEATIVK